MSQVSAKLETKGFGESLFEDVDGWFVPSEGARISGIFERIITVKAPKRVSGEKRIFVIRLDSKCENVQHDDEDIVLDSGKTVGMSELSCFSRLADYEFGTMIEFTIGKKRRTKEGNMAWTLTKDSGVRGNKIQKGN